MEISQENAKILLKFYEIWYKSEEDGESVDEYDIAWHLDEQCGKVSYDTIKALLNQ
jgi:hypothetical protein